MPALRSSKAVPPNSNLYCAQCDSQIGIVENEWMHFTSLYAQPKEKGTIFGVEVGEKTQVVPNGTAQKAAEGLVMAEVFCKTCSTMVAQYCKSAPHPKKEHFVDQRFFKLSRIYLKDAQTSEKVELAFADGDSATNHGRESVRSSIAPKQRMSSMNADPQITTFGSTHATPSQVPAYDGVQERPLQMSPPDQNYQPPTAQTFPTPLQQSPLNQGYYSPAPQTFPLSMQPPMPGNNYQQFSYQPSPSELPQSMIVHGMSDLARQIGEHGTLMTDCSNRIVAISGRVSTEALKLTDMELRVVRNEETLQKQEASFVSHQKSLDQAQLDCSAHVTACVKHAEMIQKQQVKIDEQQVHLISLTDKLELLQQNMDELKTLMNETQARSITQSSPRPDSHDFLGNLEVMVRAMRGARTNDQEITALRNENKAMKIRLKTIAGAMGGASKEDATSEEDSDDIRILGKRKRDNGQLDEQSRKVSRRLDNSLLITVDPAPLLPTPDSTLHESEPSIASQEQSSEGNETVVRNEENGHQSSEHKSPEDDDFVMVLNDDNAADEQEPSTTVPDGIAGQPQEQQPSQSKEDIKGKGESDLLSKALIPDDVHQAHATNGGCWPIHPVSDAQMAFFPRNEQSFFGGVHATPYYGQPGSSVFNTPAPYSFQYRTNFNSRAPTPHFISGPPAVPSYFGATVFTSTEMSRSPLPESTHLGLRRTNSSAGQGPFSDALSRGQRLEEIVQRHNRPRPEAELAQSVQQDSASTKETPPHQSDASSSILQPRQPHAPTLSSGVAASAQSATPVSAEARQTVPQSSTKLSDNAESIDFSDQENTTPRVVAIPSTSQSVGPLPRLPGNEPKRGLTASTLVSKTFPGLTLEPLKRPVLIDTTPKQSASSNAYRRSTGSQPPMIPEFATAIQNLYGSAARQAATPAPTTAPPRFTYADSHPIKNADHNAKKGRKSEPLVPVSVDVVARPANGPLPVTSKVAETKGGPLADARAKEAQRSRAPAASSHENDDTCAKCRRRGNLLCCDGCPKSYHHRCLKPAMNVNEEMEGEWFCPTCVETRQQEQKTMRELGVKSQLRQQVLIERNRLAQEAMDHEEAAARQGR